MLVVAPLFQIAAFLIQFLALPFPIFALSFGLGGIGRVFQVGHIFYLYRWRITQPITYLITVFRMHLRMVSSRLFKKTLNTSLALFRLLTVKFFLSNTFNPKTDITHTIHRCWSISCSTFRNILCSIDILVLSLPYLALPSHLECYPSCRSV